LNSSFLFTDYIFILARPDSEGKFAFHIMELK